MPLGLQDIEASRIPRKSAHEVDKMIGGDKVASPTHRPLLSPRI